MWPGMFFLIGAPIRPKWDLLLRLGWRAAPPDEDWVFMVRPRALAPAPSAHTHPKKFEVRARGREH